MTTRRLHSVLLLALLLAVGGCKKKQKAAPATAAQAPTITAQAPPLPAEIKPETPAQPTDVPPTNPEPVKPKPKTKQKPAPRKPSPKPAITEPVKPDTSTVAKATPPRIVVESGGTSATATTTVAPDMPHTEEAHHRLSTEQLMQSTDANLKSLKRVLTPDERGIMQQIQEFMAQARDAMQTQDLVRAHNLALKAHLLSDELVR
jgi:outer membrane biosynthesis protein TonB